LTNEKARKATYYRFSHDAAQFVGVRVVFSNQSIRCRHQVDESPIKVENDNAAAIAHQPAQRRPKNMQRFAEKLI
jgi:hypothetical protein